MPADADISQHTHAGLHARGNGSLFAGRVSHPTSDYKPQMRLEPGSFPTTDSVLHVNGNNTLVNIDEGEK